MTQRNQIYIVRVHENASAMDHQMKNHYISQLIIKRFGDVMNVFDLKTKRVLEKKKPNKIFFRYDIYTEELEGLLQANIESEIANLLDKKILNNEVIKLSRGELYLLKRYMLLCSVRSLDESHFAGLIKGFLKNAEKYIEIEGQIYPSYKNLPSIKDLNISDHELYLRALKVFASANFVRDIACNPLATKEMLAWAMPFLESYIAFWDSSSEDEFVLTDAGMCSEYEGFHLLSGGIDVSKLSYISHQINNGKAEYAHLLASSIVMYENYSVYNLSKNRTMVMISPFFRLYYGAQFKVGSFNPETIILDKPDIWPAIIQNRKLFDIPKNVYRIGPEFPQFDDLYVYVPKKLTGEETIYVNSLILAQTNSLLGFDDATRIINSIYYYLFYEINFKSIRNGCESQEQMAKNMIDVFESSPYRELAKYCDSKGGANTVAFVDLFERNLDNLLLDFHTNPYICEYFLSRPEETIECKNLDFLGKGVGKLKFFKMHLEEIKRRKEPS